MRRWVLMSIALMGAALLLVLPVANGAGTGDDFLVVLDKRVGSYWYFKLGKPNDYAAAVASLGRPSSFRGEGNTCHVTWVATSVTVVFAVPVPAGARRCSVGALRSGSWYGITLSDPRWHLANGLRIGMTAMQVRKRYPAVRPGARNQLILLLEHDQEFTFTRLAVTLDDGGRVRTIEIPPTYVY